MRPQIEAWKDVVGYEGLYMVSSRGRVASLHYGRWRGMTISENQKGYPQVGLTEHGNQTVYEVHVLVARAYLGIPPSRHEVHHKDHTKTNNRVGNLEYVTRQTNVRKAQEQQGGMWGGSGMSLTTNRRRQICKMYATGQFTKAALSRLFQVADVTIGYTIRHYFQDLAPSASASSLGSSAGPAAQK